MKRLGLLAFIFFGVAFAQICETYNEAPELAARVATGELPAVSERLPLNPRVVAGAEGIGQYGGQFLSLFDGGRLAEFRQFGYENLVRWSPDGSEVIPNIAESWEVSENGTKYTFKLRDGLKWSDGQPFTASDIEFFWFDVETDTVITDGLRSYGAAIRESKQFKTHYGFS